MARQCSEAPWESTGVPVASRSLPLIGASRDGMVRLASPALAAMLGWARDDVVGMALSDLTHPDDRAEAVAELERAFAGDPRATLETRLLRPDGRSVWVKSTHLVCTDDLVVDFLVDISDLMQARETIQASERRLLALIDHSADIIAVVDREAHLLDANPAGERLLGWPLGEKRNTAMMDLVHPDDLPRVGAALADALAEPGLKDPVTFRIRTSDGSSRYLASVANNQLDDPAIAGIVINAHDVTDTITSLDALVATLSRATEYRDPYTAGHQAEVAALSRAIATKLGLSATEIDRIALGAAMHDIGKIAIPAEILTRPGKLSPPEWEIVKAHTIVGHEILTGANFAVPIADIVRHHHERLDGSGYPDGLTAEDIRIGARIVAVADVVDAMSSHRPYRPSLGMEAAWHEVRSHRGVLYDPDVVDAALAVTTDEGATRARRTTRTPATSPRRDVAPR